MSTSQRDRSRAERVAAMRVRQAAQERGRKVALIVGILVVLSAIVAAGTWYGGGSSAKTDSSSVAVTAGEGSVLVGDADAPVKVVIYEDFLCPFCRELEESTRDFLRENAAKGKVQVEYRPINLLKSFDYSARALNTWAAVLQHASPQAALKLHDLLFEQQPYEQSSDQVTADALRDLVEQAGADSSAVISALGTQDQTFLAAADAVVATEKLTGTPTVVIDGQQLAGVGVADLRTQIEAAVAAG